MLLRLRKGNHGTWVWSFDSQLLRWDDKRKCEGRIVSHFGVAELRERCDDTSQEIAGGRVHRQCRILVGLDLREEILLVRYNGPRSVVEPDLEARVAPDNSINKSPSRVVSKYLMKRYQRMAYQMTSEDRQTWRAYIADCSRAASQSPAEFVLFIPRQF